MILFFQNNYIEMKNYGYFGNPDNTSQQNYVWLYDMEWFSYEKIINYNYDCESRSIVPFAFTGSGDLWAWHLDYSPYIPVVFCPHDDNEGYFYAPSFEGALFRQILDFASHSNFYIDSRKSWQMNLKEARKHLLNWQRKFEKWFEKDWISEIEKLINSDLKYYQYPKGGYYVLITPEECNVLVDKYLNFDLLNKNFIWVA